MPYGVTQCCLPLRAEVTLPVYNIKVTLIIHNYAFYLCTICELHCLFLQLTGTLSDNVGIATFDKKHQEQRQQIMTTHFDGKRAHPFRAGLRSLMHGVVGGVASIPQQVITGARDEGVVVCLITVT